jgi:hypothetical protein
MRNPVIPDNVNRMWADPRFEILSEVNELLNSSRVWAGTEWVYLPIDRYKYRPIAEKVQDALNELAAEYGVEE